MLYKGVIRRGGLNAYAAAGHQKILMKKSWRTWKQVNVAFFVPLLQAFAYLFFERLSENGFSSCAKALHKLRFFL